MVPIYGVDAVSIALVVRNNQLLRTSKWSCDLARNSGEYYLLQWLALRFKDIAIYLDTVRECYEAWVIYSFMSYLLNFLHSEFSDLELHVSQKPQQKHLVPFCFLPKWRMGR